MTKRLLLMLAIICNAAGIHCKKEPPVVPPLPPQEYQYPLELSVVEAGLDEVILTLTVKDSILNSTFQLVRNDSVIVGFYTVTTNTTQLIDTTVLPQRHYAYTAYRIENIMRKDSSKPVTAQTMDTTSHDYSWTTTILGDGNSSYLLDVAIVNDTLAYAAGEVFRRDSNGYWEGPFNLVQWDGKSWTLKDVTVKYKDRIVTAPMYGIFLNDTNEIWLTSGIPVTRNQDGWIQYHLFDMGILNSTDGSLTKLWFRDYQQAYFGGAKGTLVHYDNGNWIKLQSNTTSDIQDMWGVTEEGKTEPDVYAVASILDVIKENKILHIHKNSVDTVEWYQPQRRLTSIWMKTAKIIYVTGSGVHVRKRSIWSSKGNEMPKYFTQRVRGTADNNVWVVGHFGMIVHFNGSTWKHYSEHFFDGVIYGLAVTENKVIAVGVINNKAIAIVGTKN